MPELKAFTAAILASGALLAAAAFAQGSDRWTMGAPMPSARTEVAVAELGGKIYVVGGFGGERESRNLRSKRRPLEPRRRNSARVASCGGEKDAAASHLPAVWRHFQRRLSRR
jgi:hypothetical protein